MPAPKDSIDPNRVYLDPFLVNRAQIDAGLSLTRLAGEAKVAFNTVCDAARGKGMERHTAELIARALGHKVTDLLAPWDAWYQPPAEPLGPWLGAAEWEAQGYLDQGRLAPNGLYCIVCRMQHRHTPSKRGRGKFYHLGGISSAVREALERELSKHAEVCARVGSHPHISMNHSSTAAVNHGGWWVVDDWVGAETLADQLAKGPLPKERLPRMLDEIAQGLAAMHGAGVVFRELAPSRVLIAEQDSRAVLTDFELARLLDGVPSGQRDWPEDRFRAPEVDGGDASVRSDLYSFGQVAVAAACRGSCEPDRIPVILGAAGMNKKLSKYILDCLDPVSSRRPPDVAMLLPHLAEWRRRSGA